MEGEEGKADKKRIKMCCLYMYQLPMMSVIIMNCKHGLRNIEEEKIG